MPLVSKRAAPARGAGPPAARARSRPFGATSIPNVRRSADTGAGLDGLLIGGKDARLRSHNPSCWDRVSGKVRLGNPHGNSRSFSNGAAHAVSDAPAVVVGFSDSVNPAPDAFRIGNSNASGDVTVQDSVDLLDSHVAQCP